jgi:hypothetical protein
MLTVRPAIPVRVLATKQKSTFRCLETLDISKHPCTLSLWREVPSGQGESLPENGLPKAPPRFQQLIRVVAILGTF